MNHYQLTSEAQCKHCGLIVLVELFYDIAAYGPTCDWHIECPDCGKPAVGPLSLYVEGTTLTLNKTKMESYGSEIPYVRYEYYGMRNNLGKIVIPSAKFNKTVAPGDIPQIDLPEPVVVQKPRQIKRESDLRSVSLDFD